MTRVLLAEDDTSISEPLSRALRREGYEVDVTADGPTTLDRALGEGVPRARSHAYRTIPATEKRMAASKSGGTSRTPMRIARNVEPQTK